MKVITFPAAPADFDPLTAPNEKLLRYGYPRRPDPDAEPALRRLWDKAFSQPLTVVNPILEETTAWRSRPYGAGRNELGPDGPLAGEWAGAIVDLGLPLSPDQAYTYVYGEWRVPKLVPKPPEPGSQTIGFWIGLGGWNTGNLLQAGVCATMTGSSVNYFVVTEWVPNYWKVVNFPVAAGDDITMLVCAPQVDLGFDLNAFAMMLNQRTRTATAFAISAPSGFTTADGSTAEWIVEAIDTEMPNFGTVSFTECLAGNQNGAVNLGNMDAFTVSAQAPLSGDLLATSNIDAAQNSVAVSWFAPD